MSYFLSEMRFWPKAMAYTLPVGGLSAIHNPNMLHTTLSFGLGLARRVIGRLFLTVLPLG